MENVYETNNSSYKKLRRNVYEKATRETINVLKIAVIHFFFLDGHLSEASAIDSKYINMTGLQDFY